MRAALSESFQFGNISSRSILLRNNVIVSIGVLKCFRTTTRWGCLHKNGSCFLVFRSVSASPLSCVTLRKVIAEVQIVHIIFLPVLNVETAENRRSVSVFFLFVFFIASASAVAFRSCYLCRFPSRVHPPLPTHSAGEPLPAACQHLSSHCPPFCEEKSRPS